MSPAQLGALFDATPEGAADLAPAYNVAPTDQAPIVRLSPDASTRVISSARWGFLPSWAKDSAGAAKMINARMETVASSKVYSKAFARHRCLVPAGGWYEWQKALGPMARGVRPKQPYFMTQSCGGALALAGVWGIWRGGGEPVLTFSVVTTPAVEAFDSIHDRMPLVLPPDRWASWLTASATDEDRERLLAPPPERFLATLEIRPVGPRVGDVRNDGPELIERVSVPSPADDREVPGNLSLF